jgi:hypothetical protein
MSGWGCPNEIAGKCMRLKGLDCDPGIKGCILHGRFVFSNPAKNKTAASRGDGPARADGTVKSSPAVRND